MNPDDFPSESPIFPLSPLSPEKVFIYAVKYLNIFLSREKFNVDIYEFCAFQCNFLAITDMS